MKVIFVNPPVIRSKDSSAENDFKIEGFIFHPWLWHIKGMSRILKFFHKYFGLGRGVRYGVRAGSRWPFTMDLPMTYFPYPFIMGYAASYLKKNGFNVNILDAVVDEEYNYNRFLKKVKDENADLVIIECSTPTIDIDVWFANKVSKFTRVALAGPHLNSQTIREIEDKNPDIKFYLPGEYILSSLNLANSLKEGVYQSQIIDDIDSIPFPFRNYKNITKYYDPSMPTENPQLQIYASKGCPFKCVFCMWPQVMYKGIVSFRKPIKVYEEIKECVDKYGFKSIFFDDDTFNIGDNRISELCDYLKKIGLPWTMMGRLDTSPDWLFDKMVESGCVGMRFGVETFNIDVLKKINKGIERTNFLETLKKISNKYPKLMIHLTMMKDLPEQTDEIHIKDMNILKDLGFYTDNKYRSFQLASCAPFPGTKLYNEIKDKIGSNELTNYKLYDGGMETIMKDIKKDL